jgi:hypothetical protein
LRNQSLDRLPDHNGLPIQSLQEAVLVALTPEPTIFDTAVGYRWVTSNLFIDEDVSSLDAQRDPLSSLEILSEDDTAQAETGIISEIDGFLVFLKREETEDGAEKFLTVCWTVLRNVIDYQRIKPVPILKAWI